MQVKPRQYPHPVLAHFNDDYSNSLFSSNVKISETDISYQLSLLFDISNKEIADLIINEKACYACHIECAITRFRKLFATYDKEAFFEIPASEVDGRVEVCLFILAADDLANYTNSSFHPDFEGISFKLKKGDIIAVGEETVFSADKNIDPLRKIPSIFTIILNASPDAGPFEIDLTGQKIVLMLSRENFERYKTLQGASSLQSTLASILILPALVSILEMLTSNKDALGEYADLRWFRSLEAKLRAMGINLSSYNGTTLSLAQQLIGDPITNALKSLESYMEE